MAIRPIELSGILSVCLASLLTLSIYQVQACRLGSEKLKLHTAQTVERVLDPKLFSSIYWQVEPLDAVALKRATGINITRAETSFILDSSLSSALTTPATNVSEPKSVKPDVSAPINRSNISNQQLLRDMFVRCMTDRDGQYFLAINAEIVNPFRTIELKFDDLKAGRIQSNLFKIHLPQSTFLVQLQQKLNYDECLSVKSIQLSPNVNYELECIHCDEEQQARLDRMFSKRMSQLDIEIDSTLSEKLFLGLQVLLSQEKLDFDL